MGKKAKVEKCCICDKLIDPTGKTFKIKEKMLYEDNDGIWYNFKTSFVCFSCISKIREEVKAKG